MPVLLLIAGEGRDVGKTLLGERLVKRLSSTGLRVGVVKHVHHGVDYRVKDTGRYLGAGASRVVAAGPREYMVVEGRRLGFWEAIGLLGDVDVVVVEGFRDHIPEVVRHGGCAAYIHRDGSAEIIPVGVKAPSLDEALALLLEMVRRGECRSSPPTSGEHSSQGAA